MFKNKTLNFILVAILFLAILSIEVTRNAKEAKESEGAETENAQVAQTTVEPVATIPEFPQEQPIVEELSSTSSPTKETVFNIDPARLEELTKNWKLYRNGEWGFELMYPNNWKIGKGDK
ncbi:MAG: hypothetical protein ABII25_09120 [bacterium]